MRHIGLALLGCTVLLNACRPAAAGDDLDVQRTELHSGKPGRPFFPAWSPDGSRLAFSEPVEGRAAVFVADADGRNRRQLTHGMWDVNPQWSPDGRWIAYHAEDPDHDLWVVSVEGGEPRALTASQTDDVPVGWLPDGSAVVYLQQGAGPTRTMVAPLDGGPVRRLGPEMEGNLYVVPSPDGRSLGIGVRSAGRSTIWVQAEDGEPRQLTSEGFEVLESPLSWSPDGRQLVFSSRRTGTSNLWVADITSGELRQLTQDVRDDFFGVWSPDGQWIAFRSLRGGQPDVWVVSSAGGQPRRVTADRAVETQLQWSRDSHSILFLRTEATTGLHVMAPDGGQPREIFSWREAFLGNIDVSPDGRAIAFQSNRSGVPDVWVVPVAGGDPIPVAASPRNDVQPRWSPDGRSIAFTSTRAGTPDIWVVSADGGEPRQLTDWQGIENWPVWSPDGSLIAFASDRDATQADVWVIPATGDGEPRRLTRNAAARNLMWSLDGREIFYVGAGRAGLHSIYRVPVTGGEPRLVGGNVRIGDASLSPDGSHIAYVSLTEGLGFVDVIGTAPGSDSRRLTPAAERVFHDYVRWWPDGSRLVVMSYDYLGDAYDVHSVTWPAGAWTQLTQTSATNEFNPVPTPDGRSVVFGSGVSDTRIVSVNVSRALSLMASN